MSSVTPRRVAVLQHNPTVQRLMGQFLGEESFEVEYLEGLPPGAARAQLVILDVERDRKQTERWLRHCDGRQLPVILCGVEASRKEFADRPWLRRPFTAAQLQRICVEVLDGRTPSGLEEPIPPAIQMQAQAREMPTVELPPTGEIDLDTLGGPPETTRQAGDSLLDVLDIDASSSMILEIEDLADGQGAGGVLVNKGRRRLYTDEELTGDNPWENEPDTAVDHMAAKATTDPVRPTPSEISRPSATADVTTISRWDDVASGDFSSVHRISSLLAEHWDRLGLTARPSDRADRLQRVLTAMWRDGMDGLLEELKRIPAAQGFAGRLETLPLVDLFHTLRDRGLRGRLEIGLAGHSFVLYIDRGVLEDIESLGENTDHLLLKSLHKSGALDDGAYGEYRDHMAAADGEPVELRLRSDGVVSDDALMEARKTRAKRLLRIVCNGKRGTFAFIETPEGSGQAWPTQGLGLNIDRLVLEVMRESSLEPDRRPADSRTNLVINPRRAGALEPEDLTDTERQALELFEQATSVKSAREQIESSEEPVDRVVERLRRLELLQRLGEDRPAPPLEPTSAQALPQPPEPADPQHDPQQRPTKVGTSWDLLPDVDDPESEEPWLKPELAGPDEETQQEVGFAAGVPEEWEEGIEELLKPRGEASKASRTEED